MEHLTDELDAYIDFILCTENVQLKHLALPVVQSCVTSECRRDSDEQLFNWVLELFI